MTPKKFLLGAADLFDSGPYTANGRTALLCILNSMDRRARASQIFQALGGVICPPRSRLLDIQLSEVSQTYRTRQQATHTEFLGKAVSIGRRLLSRPHRASFGRKFGGVRNHCLSIGTTFDLAPWPLFYACRLGLTQGALAGAAVLDVQRRVPQAVRRNDATWTVSRSADPIVEDHIRHRRAYSNQSPNAWPQLTHGAS
jgi:hypothetical protein